MSIRDKNGTPGLLTNRWRTEIFKRKDLKNIFTLLFYTPDNTDRRKSLILQGLRIGTAPSMFNRRKIKDRHKVTHLDGIKQIGKLSTTFKFKSTVNLNFSTNMFKHLTEPVSLDTLRPNNKKKRFLYQCIIKYILCLRNPILTLKVKWKIYITFICSCR